MYKNILIISLIIIFLSAFSCVHATDLNDTLIDSNSDETLELAVPSDDVESDFQENVDVLASEVQNNSSDVLSSSAQTNVAAAPYLILDNDGDDEDIYVGDYETWEISVANIGDAIAKNVKVFNKLPDGLKYVKHTATKGTFNPETGIWDIGDLSVEDNLVFLYITTQAISVGEKINKANLTCESDNLNNVTYEEEEIYVWAYDVDEKPSGNNLQIHHQDTMKSAGNPLLLVFLSLFGCLISVSKKS